MAYKIVAEQQIRQQYYQAVQRDPAGMAEVIRDVAHCNICSCLGCVFGTLTTLSLMLTAIGIENLAEKNIQVGVGCLVGALGSGFFAGCIWRCNRK